MKNSGWNSMAEDEFAIKKSYYDWANLLFEDPAEMDVYTLADCTDLIGLQTRILAMMGFSEKDPFEICDNVSLKEIPCRNPFFNLYLSEIPLVSSCGRTPLKRFGIFAVGTCVEAHGTEILGVIKGYEVEGAELRSFYDNISAEIEKSECARSWHYIANNKFVGYSNIFALADKELTPGMQEEIIKRLDVCRQTPDIFSTSYQLVNHVYVEPEYRKQSVWKHMMAALYFAYGPVTTSVLYLAPERGCVVAKDYNIAMNKEIAKKYGMEIVGIERPMAVLHNAVA